MVDYFEGASFFGGRYDSTNAEYRFRITRHVQQVLLGDGHLLDFGVAG